VEGDFVPLKMLRRVMRIFTGWRHDPASLGLVEVGLLIAQVFKGGLEVRLDEGWGYERHWTGWTKMQVEGFLLEVVQRSPLKS